jgi:hypothetical protein
MHTGPVVELEVAKQGAIYHGLATLLAQASPVLSPRGHNGGMRPPSTQPPASRMQPQDQHLYQNHRPPMVSPMSRPAPPGGMRSASIQNLNHPAAAAINFMGQRQASHPALMNGGAPPQQPQTPRMNGGGGGGGEDQGYYQNIGTTNLQQPMPLR